jgi:hypothetical protein
MKEIVVNHFRLHITIILPHIQIEQHNVATRNRMEFQPVDGFLGYASVVNMKVGGTLGNEGSIWVQSTPPAVVKSEPAASPDGRTRVPTGLLKLDGHAHRTVLKYLEPTWVQGV